MRSFFLGYWIPPEAANPGKPWNVFGDSVYAENTANTAFTGAFYGLDGSGPLDALPSGNYTPGGAYRHWCEWHDMESLVHVRCTGSHMAAAQCCSTLAAASASLGAMHCACVAMSTHIAAVCNATAGALATHLQLSTPATGSRQQTNGMHPLLPPLLQAAPLPPP